MRNISTVARAGRAGLSALGYEGKVSEVPAVGNVAPVPSCSILRGARLPSAVGITPGCRSPARVWHLQNPQRSSKAGP